MRHYFLCADGAPGHAFQHTSWCQVLSRLWGREQEQLQEYLPKPVWCNRAEMLKIMFLQTSVIGVFTTLLLFSRHRYLWKVSQALFVMDPSPEPPTVKMSSDLQNGMRTSYEKMRTAKCPYGGIWFWCHQLKPSKCKNPKYFWHLKRKQIRFIY